MGRFSTFKFCSQNCHFVFKNIVKNCTCVAAIYIVIEANSNKMNGDKTTK